jgi:hypothetical protein
MYYISIEHQNGYKDQMCTWSSWFMCQKRIKCPADGQTDEPLYKLSILAVCVCQIDNSCLHWCTCPKKVIAVINIHLCNLYYKVASLLVHVASYGSHICVLLPSFLVTKFLINKACHLRIDRPGKKTLGLGSNHHLQRWKDLDVA